MQDDIFVRYQIFMFPQLLRIHRLDIKKHVVQALGGLNHLLAMALAGFEQGRQTGSIDFIPILHKNRLANDQHWN
jgi:hypothetical protein